MRIAITGGAGFIGSNLADAFVDRGDDVLVIDDLSTGREAHVPKDARLERCDIRSPEASRALGAFRPDVLCHHAAQIDVRRSVARFIDVRRRARAGRKRSPTKCSHSPAIAHFVTCVSW